MAYHPSKKKKKKRKENEKRNGVKKRGKSKGGGGGGGEWRRNEYGEGGLGDMAWAEHGWGREGYIQLPFTPPKKYDSAYLSETESKGIAHPRATNHQDEHVTKQ